MEYQASLFQNANDFDSEFNSLFRMIPASETDYLTHNIHPYPAKFVPNFPRLFIKYYSQMGDSVLDPMCGSGTTLIESSISGRKAVGVDFDPIATLISKVSVTPISSIELDKYEKLLIKEIRARYKNGYIESTDLPTQEDFPNVELWFRESVLRELLVIRDTILDISETENLKNFGLLCLSLITKNVSNADPRDIFPERDLKNPVREQKNTLEEFQRALFDNKTRLKRYSKKVNNKNLCKVIQGDARELELSSNSIDLVFTSPPYAYAMDYARVHKLSTLLFIMSNKDLLTYRKNYIGTDRVSINKSIDSFEGIEFAHKVLDEVHSQDRKLGVILYQYFFDMNKVTKEIQRVLKPGKHLVYVIGNSTIKGTPFNTDEVFQKLCEENGLKIIDRYERPYFAYRMSRKRNTQSNTIKSDIFLVAEKI